MKKCITKHVMIIIKLFHHCQSIWTVWKQKSKSTNSNLSILTWTKWQLQILNLQLDPATQKWRCSLNSCIWRDEQWAVRRSVGQSVWPLICKNSTKGGQNLTFCYDVIKQAPLIWWKLSILFVIEQTTLIVSIFALNW